MSLRHYLVTAALVVLGLVGGLQLITSEEEVALIRYRDKDFETALEQYEERLASGDFSISVVMPLAQLYLQFGNVEAALALMQRFVRENPSNLEARRQLARFYQYAQRPQDYVITIEQLASSNPTEDTLRELSDIYNFHGRFDDQIKVYERLIQEYPGNPRDHLVLANLQASRGKVAEAAQTLEKFEKAHPEAITPDTLSLLLSTFLDSEQPDKALRRARDWLARSNDAETAAQLASMLNFKGQPRIALELLQPFESAADSNPVVLAELIQLEIANGLQPSALARLERLDGARRFPSSMLETYLDLLLGAKEPAKAFEVAAREDLSSVPGWLLSNLADAALAEGRQDLIKRMIESLGEDFLEQTPVLGARLALARGDRAGAARWAAAAEKRILASEQRLALASVYAELGQNRDAIRLLAALAADPSTPDSAIADLANLYLDTDNSASGLPLLERLRKQRRSAAVESSWALLAADAGEEGPVVDWLRRADARSLRLDVLENLYFVANERNKKTLALAAAERVYDRKRTDDSRLQLADALVGAGRPSEALPHLRALLADADGNSATEFLYVDALNAALAQGVPVRDELQKFWTAKLAGAGITDSRREDLVYALLSIDANESVLPTLADLARKHGEPWLFAYAEAAVKAGRKSELVEFLTAELKRGDLAREDRTTRLQLLREHASDSAALPFLREFAETAGGEWSAAYEEVLGKLGRRDELVAFWRGRAAGASVPADEKRAIAYRSLEAGVKNLAEQIFLELAQNAPPTSPDVSQLLYIWGPRPADPALDWLEARARAAKGSEKQVWLEHLLNAGAARRAVAAGGAARAEAEAGDSYLRALIAAGDTSGLAAVLKNQIASVTDPSALRRLARYALETGLQESVRAAYTKLLVSAPNDMEALRRLGSLDFVESRFEEAKDRLSRYLSMGEGDFESHFYFGELMQREGNLSKARIHFEKSLNLIERTPQKDFRTRGIRALALYRVGSLLDSVAEFERLIREQPMNKHVRADYVGILLETGRHDDARRILALP
jgi:thioredoxin-like negative regulator of GroEL